MLHAACESVKNQIQIGLTQEFLLSKYFNKKRVFDSIHIYKDYRLGLSKKLSRENHERILHLHGIFIAGVCSDVCQVESSTVDRFGKSGRTRQKRINSDQHKFLRNKYGAREFAKKC